MFFFAVGHMDGKKIEIDGEIFDLDEDEGKKAAVRAWLLSRKRGEKAREPPESAGGGDDSAGPDDKEINPTEGGGP